jgi:hypothetical protein
LFIPDPDPYFLPIPDPGVKKAPDPGSGSATLPKTPQKYTTKKIDTQLYANWQQPTSNKYRTVPTKDVNKEKIP